MHDQTARGSKFPATCARCGGRISEPVAFCPHCGAHARFALAGNAPRSRSGSAGSARAEPAIRSYESADFEGDLDPPWPGPPTPLFASPDGNPYGNPYGDRYGEMRSPAFKGTRRWGLKGGTALILGAFVVIYGSAILLHRYDRTAPPSIPQDNAAKSVGGSIASNGTEGTRRESAPPTATNRNNGGDSGLQAPAPASPAPQARDSSAPDMSTASLPPPVTSTAAPVAPVQAQAPASTSGRQPLAANDAAQQVRPSGAGDAAAKASARTRRYSSADDVVDAARANAEPPVAQKDAKTGRAATARVLDGVQARLAKNDLRGARASLASVLAADPRNGYALSLREQLVSREQARDASLSAARACVVQSRWNCVWHNAGSALSVDASSTEAKGLVSRAIIESGAATRPAGPGPDTVQVPMVQ